MIKMVWNNTNIGLYYEFQKVLESNYQQGRGWGCTGGCDACGRSGGWVLLVCVDCLTVHDEKVCGVWEGASD